MKTKIAAIFASLIIAFVGIGGPSATVAKHGHDWEKNSHSQTVAKGHDWEKVLVKRPPNG